MPFSSAYLAAEVANEYGSNRFSGTRFCPSCGIQMAAGYSHSPTCQILVSALAQQNPVFVQAATPVDSGATSGATSQVLLSGQTAGNLNFIAFAWLDTTSTILSVNDSANNVYVPVFSSPIRGSAASLVIYYCVNIQNSAAGGLSNNSVTITLSASATYRIMHLLEYSGISRGPIDVSGSAFSTGTGLSVPITTLNATDIIIAFFYTQGGTITAGQTSRSFTTTDGSLVEDLITTSAGSHPMGGTALNQPWVGGAVAFIAGILSPVYPGAILHD